MNDAARCCLEATSFFDLVQCIYVFLSGSTRRWEVVTRHVPTLTLKPLSETRWESQIDALKPLRYGLGNIYDALIEIADDDTLTRSASNTARSDANSLAMGISIFKFVVSIIVGHDILFEINLTSKLLQVKEFDIHSAIKQLEQTNFFFL